MSSKPELRIGTRVVCTKGDCFISEGQTGVVVNVLPALYQRPAVARILWANETVTRIEVADIKVLPKENAA
jgi:hypothetical protein